MLVLKIEEKILKSSENLAVADWRKKMSRTEEIVGRCLEVCNLKWLANHPDRVAQKLFDHFISSRRVGGRNRRFAASKQATRDKGTPSGKKA
jgi:hypothetical protein